MSRRKKVQILKHPRAAAAAADPAIERTGSSVPITLITCSGISNTGKLTTQAALALLQRRPGSYVWVRAQQNCGVPADEIEEAERVIVLDGCADCCAKKKLTEAGFIPDHHLVATEIGITKNGMADVQFAEISKVVTAVLEMSR